MEASGGGKRGLGWAAGACRSRAPDRWPARHQFSMRHGCRGRPSPEQTSCTTSTPAAASHAKTCPPSASAPASRQVRARGSGRTWPQPSTRSSPSGSSSRTSAGCCPHPRHGHPQKETTMNDATQVGW